MPLIQDMFSEFFILQLSRVSRKLSFQCQYKRGWDYPNLSLNILKPTSIQNRRPPLGGTTKGSRLKKVNNKYNPLPKGTKLRLKLRKGKTTSEKVMVSTNQKNVWS